MVERVTPDLITSLNPNEVFVFGSNYRGIHGKGAAKTAIQWGAKYGCGEGLWGMTYALPTKGIDLRLPLSIERICLHVSKFLECTNRFPDFTFLVTEVGCGLAGYGPKQIAPLFLGAVDLPNIHLPQSFWNYLTPTP